MQMLEAHRPDRPADVHSGYLTGPVLAPLSHFASHLSSLVPCPLSSVQFCDLVWFVLLLCAAFVAGMQQ